MITPTFTFDAEANAYISDDITIDECATARIELASRAPVVTLKRENDGGYANYGQTPKSDTGFQIDIHVKHETVIRLATPVEVTKCFILN